MAHHPHAPDWRVPAHDGDYADQRLLGDGRVHVHGGALRRVAGRTSAQRSHVAERRGVAPSGVADDDRALRWRSAQLIPSDPLPLAVRRSFPPEPPPGIRSERSRTWPRPSRSSPAGRRRSCGPRATTLAGSWSSSTPARSGAASCSTPRRSRCRCAGRRPTAGWSRRARCAGCARSTDLASGTRRRG